MFDISEYIFNCHILMIQAPYLWFIFNGNYNLSQKHANKLNLLKHVKF
jgi:hypothetical protein